jgi:hypothetical protein
VLSGARYVWLWSEKTRAFLASRREA